MTSSLDGRGPRRVAIAVGLILLVATLARFVGLDYHSLRNDELASWQMSRYETFAEVIERGVGPDPHPPGFQFILWLVEHHVGDSAPIMRATSAVGGILAVFVMFLLGRRLWGDREGLTAAALTAISHAAIYYSQDARAYSLLFLTSVASSLFLWTLVKGLDRDTHTDRTALAGFVITSAAACYLHYFGLVLFSTQLAYYCGAAIAGGRWSRLGIGLLALGSVAVLYMPWWGGFFEDLTARQAPPWIVPPGQQFPLRLLDFFLNRSTLLVTATLALLLFILVVELTRVWGQRRSFSLFDELRTPEFFIAWWLFAPLAAVYVRSYLSEPVASLRNMIIVAPAVYLAAARGLALLPAKWRLRDAATFGFLLVALLQLLFGIRYYTTPQKHQFREAAQYVVDHEPERPNAPVYAFTNRLAYYNYYLERLGSASRVSLIAGREADIETMASELARERPRAFWYLTGTRTPEPAFLDSLSDAGYRIADERTFYGTSASYYVHAGIPKQPVP